LGNGDYFGYSVAALFDVNSDKLWDVVACAPYNDGGGTDRGVCYVLFLRSDGKVKSFSKIGSGLGSFTAGIIFQNKPIHSTVYYVFSAG
jgi:hypothetical protein